MDEDYNVTEIELSDEQIDTWIERLKEIKEVKEHIHLEYKNGEVLVYGK
jgi:hypothetical protein